MEQQAVTEIMDKQTILRNETLLKQRREILSMPPEEALNAILDSPNPTPLVHSFPEDDLYFLIHEIGPEDSLPLLSLASSRQWEYILDLEIWEKDRIKMNSVVSWLDLLLEADPKRLIKWFLDQKIEFFEFFLHKNIELRIRNHDQDPSDFEDNFFTFDDTFYFRFIDNPMEFESMEIDDKRRKSFLKFLQHLAFYDHIKYRHILLESAGIIPAESEEKAYRLRNVRLAEKGFLPFDEAVSIYTPLNPERLKKQNRKFITDDLTENIFIPVPFCAASMLKEDNLFVRSLRRIKNDKILHQIQLEFAGLNNQIIVADLKTIKNRNQLNTIVKKACGYISIGLKRLTKENEKLEIDQGAELIQKFPLFQIFRTGYGLVVKVKSRAEKWRGNSWFSKKGLPLSFWDEKWLGVLGGILIKRPLFFDNYKTGVLYRDFTLIEEIIETEKILDEIIAFDNLFSLMTVQFESFPDHFITYKNLILTLWARDYLKLPDESEELIPLSVDEFKSFFNHLFPDHPVLRSMIQTEKIEKKIALSMKESFLNWLSNKTGISNYEISTKLGNTLEDLFEEIESEYGKVSEKDLDPKYIRHFLITYCRFT